MCQLTFDLRVRQALHASDTRCRLAGGTRSLFSSGSLPLLEKASRLFVCHRYSSIVNSVCVVLSTLTAIFMSFVDPPVSSGIHFPRMGDLVPSPLPACDWLLWARIAEMGQLVRSLLCCMYFIYIYFKLCKSDAILQRPYGCDLNFHLGSGYKIFWRLESRADSSWGTGHNNAALL